MPLRPDDFDYEILDCSERMLPFVEEVRQPLDGKTFTSKKSGFPFDILEHAQSFKVMFGQIDEVTLRKAASYRNKKCDGKKFRVQKYDDWQCFEVGRLR